MTPLQRVIKEAAGINVSEDEARKIAFAVRARNSGPPRHIFLDNLIEVLFVKNDAALSCALDVAPPIISRIRHGKLAVQPALLIKAHELTGWTFPEMREMLGTA